MKLGNLQILKLLLQGFCNERKLKTGYKNTDGLLHRYFLLYDSIPSYSGKVIYISLRF